ncbi:MAG: DUF1294 domain-containing protein [Methanoregulaceae archaeon]|nr:DUF1294 domain-containing protein [Methanoregulaceae archaeon]
MIQFEPSTGILASLLCINAGVFLLFGYDKHQARRDGWRVPERTLLLSSLAGPFGAFSGMNVFHHKTRKPAFFILVPAFIVLQVVCAVIISGGI